MELNTQQVFEPDVKVVSIRGSIDALTAGDVESYFDKIIGEGGLRIIANLDQVDFMSSSGLRMILSVSKSARRHGGDLRLAAARPGVEKMLKISGFTSIMRFFPSLDEAVESYRV